MELKSNLTAFLKEFQQTCKTAGKSTREPEILYAVKYLTPLDFASFLDTAIDLKITPVIVGENRVQLAEEKMEFIKRYRPDLGDKFRLVMIGSLQKNKINKALELFEEIHSVDSMDLAKALNQRLTGKNKIMPVYLEVNVSGELSKHGFKPEELENVVKSLKLLRLLKIKGLMTMAPDTEDLEEIRGVFRKLRVLANKYGLKTSMGMSGDWKIAVEEGSDMIRIGKRVFDEEMNKEYFMLK